MRNKGATRCLPGTQLRYYRQRSTGNPWLLRAFVSRSCPARGRGKSDPNHLLMPSSLNISHKGEAQVHRGRCEDCQHCQTIPSPNNSIQRRDQSRRSFQWGWYLSVQPGLSPLTQLLASRRKHMPRYVGDGPHHKRERSVASPTNNYISSSPTLQWTIRTWFASLVPDGKISTKV